MVHRLNCVCCVLHGFFKLTLMVHFGINFSKIPNWIVLDSFLLILTKIVSIYKPGLLYTAISKEYFWAAISSWPHGLIEEFKGSFMKPDVYYSDLNTSITLKLRGQFDEISAAYHWRSKFPRNFTRIPYNLNENIRVTGILPWVNNSDR